MFLGILHGIPVAGSAEFRFFHMDFLEEPALSGPQDRALTRHSLD